MYITQKMSEKVEKRCCYQLEFLVSMRLLNFSLNTFYFNRFKFGYIRLLFKLHIYIYIYINRPHTYYRYTTMVTFIFVYFHTINKRYWCLVTLSDRGKTFYVVVKHICDSSHDILGVKFVLGNTNIEKLTS